jgi:RHS repeat-associated protein
VENRLISVTGGANCIYDGDGNRVKKTEGGQTILYINQYYEKNMTTGVVTTYYYLGGQLVAQSTGGTLKYIHQDSLGSTSVMSTSTGTLDSSISYFPFGATRTGSVNTTKEFTGQRLDSTGLYYYGARYYDATIGRFISPDTLSQIAPSRSDMQISLSVSYSDTSVLLKFNQAQRQETSYRGTHKLEIIQ